MDATFLVRPSHGTPSRETPERGASAQGVLEEMRGETQHALAEFERTVLAGQEAAARRVETLLASHAAGASTPADLDALADPKLTNLYHVLTMST